MLTLLLSLCLMSSAETVIAVIDTGADLNHPYLKNYIWKNNKEIPGNGIDDDKNGYIDDLNGFDFSKRTGKISDQHGHGTHIAGIITNTLKEQNIPNVKLMILKFFNPKAAGDENLKASIEAFRYATKMGAHIINYSGGGPQKNTEEFSAVKEATTKGIVVVAASGNEKSNSDLFPFYPADYELENIISVTAIDSFKQVLPTSNYGQKSVQIAAPGKEILSALPDSKLGTMTGTSQATAFVSAAVAVLRERRHDLRAPAQAAAHLIKTSSISDGLNLKTKFSSYLKLERSLQMQDSAGLPKSEQDQLLKLAVPFNHSFQEERISLQQ